MSEKTDFGFVFPKDTPESRARVEAIIGACAASTDYMARSVNALNVAMAKAVDAEVKKALDYTLGAGAWTFKDLLDRCIRGLREDNGGHELILDGVTILAWGNPVLAEDDSSPASGVRFAASFKRHYLADPDGAFSEEIHGRKVISAARDAAMWARDPGFIGGYDLGTGESEAVECSWRNGRLVGMRKLAGQEQ